jgi:ATP-independent RNA helicase DbpA
VRPGDVLGALTGDAGIPGTAVGKIDLFDFQCFVAVDEAWADKALARLEKGKVKGRKIRVRYA